MRILFILEYYHPHIGGVETLFKSLAEALADQEHDVTILTNRYEKGLPSFEKNGNIKIHRYSFFNRYLFTLFAFFPSLVLAFKHDIIQTTSYNAGIPAFFAGLISRRKVIICFHEAWNTLWLKLPFFSKLSLRLHYWFEKFLLKLPFHHFIAVSDHTKNSLIEAGISGNKITRIYNGINYLQFDSFKHLQHRLPQDPFSFIYFGRLGISKGLDILLGAIAKLKVSGRNFVVDIVIPKTPASMYENIMDLAGELNIVDHIRFHHNLERKDLFTRVANANTVVIPSYAEGFCYTAVESMAIGTPIVCAYRAALKEVISGKHLFFKDFSSAGLKKTMELAMDDKWDETAQQKFELTDTVSQYIQLYNTFAKSV